jgi:hypothetical protein
MRSTDDVWIKSILAAAIALSVLSVLALTGATPPDLVGPSASGAPVVPAAQVAPAAPRSSDVVEAPATRAVTAAPEAQAAAASTAPAAATAPTSRASGSTAPKVPAPPAGTRKPVFVMYYLWWSADHWRDRLGGSYPQTKSPAPLPATLDADGCGARSAYPGNKLTDVPSAGGYDQTAATIERDVRLAASTGVTGFAVNWNGTGSSGQSVDSTVYNRRLQWVFDAVHRINAEGIPFRVMLNYKGSATKLSTTAISGDLAYFIGRYGADPALDHTYSNRPEMVWAGSWKYSTVELTAVAKSSRSRMFLIGDEKPSTWNTGRAAQLDGASYYWSSQNPWDNPASFAQLRTLADAVHAGTNPDGRRKTWLAPFTPGYNAQLLYGTSTCVPRRDGQTMHELFRGNKATNPDGWTLISWNEISEGSYIVPLTRYGQKYTDELKTLIAANG